MAEIPVVFEGGRGGLLPQPVPVVLTDKVVVRDLLPHLISLFNLPPLDEENRSYHYALRRQKNPDRIMFEAVTPLEAGVVAGEIIVIEPAVPLGEILSRLSPLAGSRTAFARRLAEVVALLPIFSQLATILETDARQGRYYQWVDPDTILVKYVQSTPTVYLVDKQKLAQDVPLHLLSADERAARARQTVFVSPEQRDGSIATELTSNVFAVGAVVYLALLGKVPVIQPDTPVSQFGKLVLGQTPELGQRITGVLMHALEPDAARRYQTPTIFLAELKAATSEWHAQNQLCEAALAATDTTQALELMHQLKADYQTAWQLTPQLRRLEEQVVSAELDQKAEELRRLDKPEEELEVLEVLAGRGVDVSSRIRVARVRISYKSALFLKDAPLKEDRLRALALLKALPSDYLDTSRQIEAILKKLN